MTLAYCAIAGRRIAAADGAGESHLNIILVSSATARARTLTLDWRHWTAGGFGVLALFLSFTLLFNYVTLRYAAAINHPLLQAILLADQREEAQKAQEVVQGHLNAMAVQARRPAGADAAPRRTWASGWRSSPA